MTFAYLFERFPSFTQTFCNREVAEMFGQGMEPAVYSIRAADQGSSFPAELLAKVRYLPAEAELNREVRRLRAEHKIHSDVWQVFTGWGDRGDKARLYEAAWLGVELKRRGIRHVHAHFAGMAARTAYWIKKLWGIGYGFTGHANDIFCETDFPVSLADLVREARLVVTETDFSRDWLRTKFPEQARKFARCYNGIDLERFAPATETDRGARIISVGRLIEKKGFADLIDACRLLRNHGVAFECDIVGGGPLEAQLREQIDRAELGGRVRLTGPRDEREVLAMLRHAAVFVLPCVRDSEGGGSDNLPTVIMEAMACGLPVVSTRIAGIPEMVRNRETGFLVSERNPAELAEALSKLLSDSARAWEFGRLGRALAESQFSTAVTTRRLKRLLVSAAQVRPAVRAVVSDPGLAVRYASGLIGV